MKDYPVPTKIQFDLATLIRDHGTIQREFTDIIWIEINKAKLIAS